MANPEFYNLIKRKAELIDSIPEKFITGVKKSEKQILDGILELLSQMEIRGGQFVASAKNLEIASQINERIKQVMLQSEYATALTEFAKGFDIQAELTQEYFVNAFESAVVPEIVTGLVATSKRNAIDLLINRASDSEFLSPLRDIIETSVINNATYAETLTAIRELVEGSDQFESRLVSYSRTIAHDTFAVADRSVISAYSNENQFEWYLYAGAEMKTTRPFCAERAGEYFHRKEIEAWGEGKRTDGMAWPQSGGWGGRIDGTSGSNIFSYLGGYNCGHIPMPVSVFAVPRDVIIRNIDQGFYKPSRTVAERFELS